MSIDQKDDLPPNVREGYDPCRSCGQKHGEECEQWGYDNGWREGDRAATERIVAWLRDGYAKQSAIANQYDIALRDDWEDAADAIERGDHEH